MKNIVRKADHEKNLKCLYVLKIAFFLSIDIFNINIFGDMCIPLCKKIPEACQENTMRSGHLIAR